MTQNPTIENALSRFDEQFGAAETTASGQVDLPEGKYQMKIADCEIFTAKDGERNFFKMTLVVDAGEHKGVEVVKLHSLDNPERFKFLKGDLATCGLLLTKLSALPSEMKKLIGTGVNVQCKKKDQYTNYYINGRFTGQAVETPDTPF